MEKIEKKFTIEMTLKVGQIVLWKRNKPMFGKYEIVAFDEDDERYVTLKPLFKTDVSLCHALYENVLPLW